METFSNLVKVKFGIKVIKLVKIRENWSKQSEHMQAPPPLEGGRNEG